MRLLRILISFCLVVAPFREVLAIAESALLPFKTLVFPAPPESEPSLKSFGLSRIEILFNSECVPFPLSFREAQQRNCVPPFQIQLISRRGEKRNLPLANYTIHIEQTLNSHHVQVSLIAKPTTGFPAMSFLIDDRSMHPDGNLSYWSQPIQIHFPKRRAYRDRELKPNWDESVYVNLIAHLLHNKSVVLSNSDPMVRYWLEKGRGKFFVEKLSLRSRLEEETQKPAPRLSLVEVEGVKILSRMETVDVLWIQPVWRNLRFFSQASTGAFLPLESSEFRTWVRRIQRVLPEKASLFLVPEAFWPTGDERDKHQHEQARVGLTPNPSENSSSIQIVIKVSRGTKRNVAGVSRAALQWLEIGFQSKDPSLVQVLQEKRSQRKDAKSHKRMELALCIQLLEHLSTKVPKHIIEPDTGVFLIHEIKRLTGGASLP